MKIRIVVALLAASLAHAGAYGLILVSSPQKANVQIAGGSISISLAPTDEVYSEQSDSFGEESEEQDEPASQEPVVETDQPESIPEPVGAESAIAPVPELPVEADEPASVEPKMAPEPETEAVTEDGETMLGEDPAQRSNSDSKTSAEFEAKTTVDTLAPTGSPTDSGQGNSGAAPESRPAGESSASADTPSAVVGSAAQDNYNGELMRHMRRARKFDTNARRKAKIAITIDVHGDILEVRVLRASGDKTWDRRVIKELKRIAPYPAPPSGRNHSWTFDAVPK